MSPILKVARFRHAEHYLGILRSAESLYFGGNQNVGAGLGQFDLERENINLGQTWASEHYQNNKETAELCKDYGIASGELLGLRLHSKEWIRWLDHARLASRQLSDRSAEGTILINMGIAYFNLGDSRKAIEFYEQALIIVRNIGDRRGEANALGDLGNAHINLGNARGAIKFYELALVHPGINKSLVV